MLSVSYLLSDRQLRILSTALFEPHKTFSLTDLAQAAGPGHGATQRYVRQLLDGEVLITDTSKRQRRYQANARHPLFAELRSICGKAAGLPLCYIQRD
jgi:hypothetical protein